MFLHSKGIRGSKIKYLTFVFLNQVCPPFLAFLCVSNTSELHKGSVGAGDEGASKIPTEIDINKKLLTNTQNY